MIRLARRVFVTLIASAGLALLALLLAVRTARLTGWWPLEALDTLALYAYTPFVLVAVAALLLWSRTLAAIAAVALIAFAQQFGPQLVSAVGGPGPSIVTAQEQRPRLRVLTLNLHAPNDDPLPFLALVEDAQPDVIVFQEVTLDFFERFDRLVRRDYRYTVRAGTETSHEGSATWSRRPLTGAERLRPGYPGNIMHRVQVVTERGPIWLYNVHLANPIGISREASKLALLTQLNGVRRDVDLAWLIDETQQLELPFVLAGDFNTAAGSNAYRRFPSSWRDAFALAGRGFGHTYPAPAHEAPESWLRFLMPMVRIDYVLTSPELRPVRAWTLTLPESDHLAVVADLEL